MESNLLQVIVPEIYNTLRKIEEVLCNPLPTTTPKRVRNEAAVCGNCPYVFIKRDGQHICCRTLVDYDADVFASTWCGDHPDFWKEEA